MYHDILNKPGIYDVAIIITTDYAIFVKFYAGKWMIGFFPYLLVFSDVWFRTSPDRRVGVVASLNTNTVVII